MREHSSALPWRNSLEIEKEKKGCGQRGRRPGSPLSIFERTREPLSTRVIKEAAFETWPPLSVVHRRLGIVLPSSVSLAFPPSDWIFPSKKGGRYFIVIEVRGVFFSPPDFNPTFERNFVESRFPKTRSSPSIFREESKSPLD